MRRCRRWAPPAAPPSQRTDDIFDSAITESPPEPPAKAEGGERLPVGVDIPRIKTVAEAGEGANGAGGDPQIVSGEGGSDEMGVGGEMKIKILPKSRKLENHRLPSPGGVRRSLS